MQEEIKQKKNTKNKIVYILIGVFLLLVLLSLLSSFIMPAEDFTDELPSIRVTSP